MLSMVLLVSVTANPEVRCGWFDNPTPGNATLTDADRQWTIATQGGFEAKGDWPEIPDAQRVPPNGPHGYGCACVTAEVDRANGRITRIVKAVAKPLSACRNDPKLKEPGTDGPWFSVTSPKGWRQTFADGCVQLSLPKLAPGDAYTFQLCQFDKPLEMIAEGELTFQRDDAGRWLRTAGRSAPSPVDALRGKGWNGLIAEQACGISDETGPHTGVCLVGVVSDGRRSVTFDSTGTFGDRAVLRKVVMSVRWR
jgi:Protein of unknown function (DUF4087)